MLINYEDEEEHTLNALGLYITCNRSRNMLLIVHTVCSRLFFLYIHTFLMAQFAFKVCYYQNVLDSDKLFFLLLPKFPASQKMNWQLSFGLWQLHGEQDMVNWASQS